MEANNSILCRYNWPLLEPGIPLEISFTKTTFRGAGKKNKTTFSVYKTDTVYFLP